MKANRILKSKAYILTILSLIIALTTALLLAGCGGTNLEGTWTVDRIVVDGTTVRPTDSDKKGHESDFNNQIILENDNTGSIKLGDATAQSATWQLDNKTLTITYGDEQTLVLTVNGSEISSENEGVKIFYKKSA